jgi:hypothetical protein
LRAWVFRGRLQERQQHGRACRRARLDVHHRLTRARGGSDFDLDHLVAVCRPCHEQTDAPYARGRLAVNALGAGRFAFEFRLDAGQGSADVVDRWESPRPSA